MTRFLGGIVLLFLLALLTVRQGQLLRQRPVELKLGPVLSPTLVRLFAPDHAASLSFRTVTRVMFYFGSFFESRPTQIQAAPEHAGMYQHLTQAVKLDPYNMDAYYFAQAAFTWEIGRVREVNAMLDYGMKYRTGDYLLPFYAGFNAAYFLKDYAQAARYFQMAADRSGNVMFANLAARYFSESGQTELGVNYLETMIKGAKDQRARLIFERRRDALLAVRRIEAALAGFNARFGRPPEKLADLVLQGLMKELPVDPYGGTFYLDEQGHVRTTSKFALKAPEAKPRKAAGARTPGHEEKP